MTTKAERCAQELLSDYAVHAVPVPVEVIAKRRGALIRHRRFDGDISGLLLRAEDGSTIIGVHSQQPKTRQRFTIAHELGHFVMHDGRPVIVEHLHRARANWRDGTSGLATDREEIEANQFAAELLMPSQLVEIHFRSLTGRQSEELLLDTLARKFEVSSQAMRFRLVNLALIDPV